MTDNEIIKALECCSDDEPKFCSVCPYYLQDKDNDYCREDMNKDALSIINRQKAEIERLEDLGKCYYTSLQQIAKSNHEIKAEAIKEFAERLKKVSAKRTRDVYGERIFFKDIDNLVKEMVGDTNDQ